MGSRICLILQIVYWFNPLLIWTRRQMRHVCEICCDLSVANVLREKTRAYRDTLLNTARELLTESVEPSLGLLGLFEEPFRIVTRLRWLEKTTWENRKWKLATTLCTSLLMFACVMPMGKASQPGDLQTNVQEEPDIAGPSVLIHARIVLVDDKEKLDRSWERSFAATDNGLTFGGDHYPSLDSWLAEMERENVLSVISAPRVIARDNEEVTLINQTVADSEDDMEQLPRIYLAIISQIKPDRFVSLDISLESEKSDGTKKEYTTEIMLKDAETTVLGGIYPYGKTEEKELRIFLTPHIIEKPRMPSVRP